jgi:hypothetical protein
MKTFAPADKNQRSAAQRVACAIGLKSAKILVEADRLICFSETLLEGDAVPMAALITMEFLDAGSGASKLTLTDEITSFVGPEGREGHRTFFSLALDNLQRMLAG